MLSAQEAVKYQSFPDDWFKRALDDINELIKLEIRCGRTSATWVATVSNGCINFNLEYGQINKIAELLQSGFGYKVEKSSNYSATWMLTITW